MDVFSAEKIKNLLKGHNLSPKKGLGQNFLIDKHVLKKILDAADLEPDDVVLEIGPGPGVLTLELAKYAKRVVAVEKDEKMASALRDILQKLNIQNVEIVTGDALKIPYADYDLPAGKYKIIANLPYYITAPIIRKFLESEQKPELMVLMVQKEVAQRICAKPPHLRQGFGGQAKMNLLAVSVQFYAKPEIVSFVSKKSFWPEPKVDSAIMKLEVESEKLKVDNELFFKIVKAGFSQPRKQILNNFSRKLDLRKEEIIAWLAENNIKPESRAEILSMNDWLRLCRTF